MAHDAQLRQGWSRRLLYSRLRYGLEARWWWWLAGAVGASAAGFVWGYATGRFVATAELDAPEGSAAAAVVQEAGTSCAAPVAGALVSLARSDLVLRRTAQASGSVVRPETVAAMTEVAASRESGLITITARSRCRDEALRLANAYADELVAAAQELFERRQHHTQQQFHQALAAVDAELDQVSRQLAEFQRRAGGWDFDADTAGPVRQVAELDQRAALLRGQLAGVELEIEGLVRELTSLNPALVAAREALAQALTRYTEEHPRVKELRAAVAALETPGAAQHDADSPPAGTLNSPAAASLHLRLGELKNQQATLLHELEGLIVQRQQLQAQIGALADLQAEQVRLKSRFAALKQQRFGLARSLEGPAGGVVGGGCARVISRATPDSLGLAEKVRRGGWGALGGALVGLAASGLLALGLPAAMSRIRSARALGQVTQLPVLGSLDALTRMSAEQRHEWAFSMFTRLRAKLAGADGQPLVCGFISAEPGEGRSTWIGLLAEAARQQGYDVVRLDISRSQPSGEGPAEPGSANGLVTEATPARWLPEVKGTDSRLPLRRRDAVLPAAWAWSLDHRVQWRQALREWQTAPRLVVLVELPPASFPEAVLLAEGLPNLIWLGGCGTARAVQTRQHLETLRAVGAGLIGCVFNNATPRRPGSRRSRGAGLVSLLAGMLLATLVSGPAQETNFLVPGPVPVTTNLAQTISICTTVQLAEWQKRFTLGPGDTFDLSLYERPETARAGITIGPDGRINYLEARDVMAAGLTIDELRAKLEEILAKFHRAPRVVINPTAFVSKKYYVLGNVNGRGVYPLDRPTSLVEAVARARGFVMAYPQQQTWPQADFGRSFLIRRRSDGTFGRVPVDFEALFLEGDLSQNIALEPDDYLFFPPLETQEVYVLGEVNAPGPLPYTPNLTALGAIAARGGFTTRAYKSKVVVVRGSLSRPQTFVVNVADVWKARALDLRLQNRDMVYVHERPFARAEELVEQAALTFVQSLATGWANLQVFGRVRGFR